MIGSMPFTAKSFVIGRKDRETLKQWIRSPTMGAQTSDSTPVVFRQSALPCLLHADERLVAQSGRAMVALITSQAIRRGSFDSVRSLERAINRYLAHWNETAKPFR